MKRKILKSKSYELCVKYMRSDDFKYWNTSQFNK